MDYIAYILLYFISGTGFKAYYMPSESMLPTIKPYEYLVCNNKPSIKSITSDRGKIVVFFKNKNENVSYVKRVIGVEGDKIQMIDGVIYINDKKVTQKKIRDEEINSEIKNATRLSEELPNGKLYYI